MDDGLGSHQQLALESTVTRDRPTIMEDLFHQLQLDQSIKSSDVKVMAEETRLSGPTDTVEKQSNSPTEMENSTTDCGSINSEVEMNNNESRLIPNTHEKHLMEDVEMATTTTDFGAQKTTNNYFINNNTGEITMNINSAKTPYQEFYATPQNGPSSTNSKLCSETTSRRALDFDPVGGTTKRRGTSPNRSKKIKRVLENQRQIPFPCRKKSAFASKPDKHASSETAIVSAKPSPVENNIYIENNRGNITIGDHNNMFISKKLSGKLDDAAMEADGSCESISPEKPIKLTMDENYKLFLEAFYEHTNQLHPLRDNGRFDEFYRQADDIKMAHANEPQVQIFIIIEKSITLNYQKDFDSSEELIDLAMKMISNLGVKMRDFLLAYSHCHKAALLRRKNLLTKANYSAIVAMQIEEFLPFCIARVFVVYEQASNLTKEVSIISVAETEPRKIKEEEAKAKLKECISLAEMVIEENPFIYLKRHQFALVKLALMNLNCRTRPSRSQDVHEDNILEAERCITRMEEMYGSDMSESIAIQFYTAKCDLCFRRKNFYDAGQFAERALDIATSNNFHLEIQPLEEKIDDINVLLRNEE